MLDERRYRKNGNTQGRTKKRFLVSISHFSFLYGYVALPRYLPGYINCGKEVGLLYKID